MRGKSWAGWRTKGLNTGIRRKLTRGKIFCGGWGVVFLRQDARKQAPRTRQRAAVVGSGHFSHLYRIAAMKRISFWAALAFLLSAGTAFGQGVLIVVNPPHPVPLPRPIPTPRSQPPMSYKIKELDYQAKITDQVAQVAVTESFVNTGRRQIEVSFVFPVPYDGAIDRMTFMIDGKEYDAKLLDAKEARRAYEEYVRRSQDPALLEWVGYGMFKTSVFPVPPGAERKVSLKFSQLLRKDGKLTDLIIPLSTAKYTSSPVEKLSIHAAIETTHELKNVYSPTHSVNIERPDSKHAIVKLEAKNSIPTTDFHLLFDSADGKLGASVISYRPDKDDEGFFLLLASPEIKTANDERPAKTVIFVVDRSGSMSGKKIEQAKEALKFVLNNLRAGDTFNIVAYDSTVESFRPELQKYDDDTRKSALGLDRKSTRLNSSHLGISYAVFCLK